MRRTCRRGLHGLRLLASEHTTAAAAELQRCACPEHASTSMQAGAGYHAKCAGPAACHAWPHAMPFSTRHLASLVQPEQQVVHDDHHPDSCSLGHASHTHSASLTRGDVRPLVQGIDPNGISTGAAPPSPTSSTTGAALASSSQQQGANITTSELAASRAGGYATGVTTLTTGHGFKKTFYKRKLPTPPAIEFASIEGRQLFAESLAAGHMAGFFKLMEQFSTQDEPAFCGLASLAMVLNALAIDPRRTWKGAWRWFHEQMLDCCRPLEDVRREGITLTQAACLSRCNGARVDLHRYGTFTIDDLRTHILSTCSSGEEHLVVSYSRRTLGQTGDGHFSPVGGYHAGRDLVLILDVARFKYPPHWVPLHLLYEAMSHLDPVTQLPRGFLRMAPQPLLDSVLLTLDVRGGAWQAANTYLRTRAAVLAQEAAAAPGATADGVVRALVQAMPLRALEAFMAVRDQSSSSSTRGTSVDADTSMSTSSSPGEGSISDDSTQHVCGTHEAASSSSSSTATGPSLAHDGEEGSAGTSERCVPVAARLQLLVELHAMPLFQLVRHVLSESAGDTGFTAEKVTMSLLLRRPGEWGLSWGDHGGGGAKAWASLMATAGMSIVEAELLFLREQWAHMDEVLQDGGSLDATCGSGCSQRLDCAALGHVLPDSRVGAPQAHVHVHPHDCVHQQAPHEGRSLALR